MGSMYVHRMCHSPDILSAQNQYHHVHNHQSPSSSPSPQGKPGQFYAQELECFAFYKSLRNHHQIDNHTMCPPWCTTVRAAGHSFAPGVEKFLPKVMMDLKNIVRQ